MVIDRVTLEKGSFNYTTAAIKHNAENGLCSANCGGPCKRVGTAVGGVEAAVFLQRSKYKAVNIFWVPKEARWSLLKANAPQPTVGKIVDDAMTAIERDDPTLKGVLPKVWPAGARQDSARPASTSITIMCDRLDAI